jgi:nitronate monooxygenase
MTLPASLRADLLLPAVVAPMFLVTGVELVAAGCLAGLAGALTRNHCRADEEFDAQLAEVHGRLARAREEDPGRVVGPVFANVALNSVSPKSKRAALKSCRAFGVDTIITTGGDPRPFVEEAGEWGCKVFHDVTSLRFAEKAIAAGVAGIVAIGAGGGGHSGIVSHFALVPQIRRMFDGVIIMAGAVSSGAGIRAAELLGADLAYLGTRFIATQESLAPEEYKALLVSETPADLIYSGFANGVPAMWMKESIRRLGLDPEALPTPARDRSHLPAHVKPWANLWSAGHGVALIEDIPPVAELVERLRAEYEAACALPPFVARKAPA